MSYKQLCNLAKEKKSPYTCCIGCICSNGTRPFHFCKRTYRANYVSDEDSSDESLDEEEEEEEDFPPMPFLQVPAPIPILKRQTTQWVVDGQVVFNGNPNGDRLLEEDENSSSDEDSSSDEEDDLPVPVLKKETHWTDRMDRQIVFKVPSCDRLLDTSVSNYGLAHIEVSNNNFHGALEHLDDKDPIKTKINQILSLMTEVQSDLEDKL